MLNQPLMQYLNTDAVQSPAANIDQLDLKFTFTGEPRGSRYLQLEAESHLVTALSRYSIRVGDLADHTADEPAFYDHWILTDSQALEYTLGAPAPRARLRISDDDGEFFEDRVLKASNRGNYSVDLTPSRGEPPLAKEAFIYTNLVIPADPPMLFVVFQRPTYLRCVTFNVRHMWSELEVAYCVTPMFLEFPPRAVTRRVPEYVVETKCRVQPGQGMVFSWGKRGLRNIL